MVRGELDDHDAVPVGCECRTCGNACMDTLALDDDDTVTCLECGSVYSL